MQSDPNKRSHIFACVAWPAWKDLLYSCVINTNAAVVFFRVNVPAEVSYWPLRRKKNGVEYAWCSLNKAQHRSLKKWIINAELNYAFNWPRTVWHNLIRMHCLCKLLYTNQCLLYLSLVNQPFTKIVGGFSHVWGVNLCCNQYTYTEIIWHCILIMFIEWPIQHNTNWLSRIL